MITHLSVKDFKAVPWLETSELMRNHPNGIAFSLDKPNVIVGPNGAGKSALLRAVSLKTLTHTVGYSALDRKYLESDNLWGKSDRWSREVEFLPGLQCETDMAPAVFYRPNHMPGNERMIAAAIMMGYCEDAKAYARQTEHKSSGQQAQAVQQRLWDVLAGKPLAYERVNWGYHDDYWPKGQNYMGDLPYMVRKMLDLYVEGYKGDGIPMAIADEPEQSLDALAEAELWQRVLTADLSKVQVLIASHSTYPFLQPERFNIIEASPGYVTQVRNCLQEA